MVCSQGKVLILGKKALCKLPIILCFCRSNGKIYNQIYEKGMFRKEYEVQRPEDAWFK